MPIIKSAVKDVRRTERRTERNRAAKGKLRASVKLARTALAAGTAEAAKTQVAQATPILDRAVSKKILHKNAAARHKSRLMRRLNKLSGSASA